MSADAARVCLTCLALLAGGLAFSYLTDGFISEEIEHAGCPGGDRCMADGARRAFNWRGAECHCHAPCDSDPWWP